MPYKCELCRDTKVEPGIPGPCVWCLAAADAITHGTGTVLVSPDSAQHVPLKDFQQSPPVAGIPEGFALVPKSMLLDKEIIQAINFHCGDGEDGQFGSYSDGSLWVGVITDDDGKEVHGLHIATAEYPEEGSTTLVEFAAPVAPQAEAVTMADLEGARIQRDHQRKRADGLQNELDTLRAQLAERDAQALERAAKWVDRRLAEYVRDHGMQDPDTGTLEFPGDGAEYAEELDFIASSIRALSATAEPAYQGHASDCATNNRGVPELLGPCDCGYEDLAK